MKLQRSQKETDPKETSPVQKVVDFVNAAQNGNYSTTLPVASPGEMGELERSVNRLVEELRENRERWEEQKELQKELKISRVIQSTLLPASAPQIPGLEILSFYRPARQVGGDYYDFIAVDPDHWGIAIADVAGKSVSGAMVMAIARNTLRTQAMQTLSPCEVLEKTQRFLLPNMMPQFFVSVFYAVLDTKNMRLTCANAGHPPLLWVHAAEKRFEWVRPEGIALGFVRNGSRPAATEEKEILLEPDDLALFYTDGITEAANATGSYLGRERLAHLAVGAAGQGAKTFLSTLERELAAFEGDLPQADDMTAVVLCRKEALLRS